MRKTKEEAEITRRRLLSAALEVFSRKGYSATRLEDIARRAEVTTGAIYHHFGGKSQVYEGLVEESSKRINQLANDIVKEGGKPLDVLRRLLTRLFQYVEEDPEYRAVLELALNKTEFLPELVSITEQTVKGRQLLGQFFVQLIEEGIRVGEFRADIVPEDAALTLVGFMNGMGLIWVQDPEYFSIKERAEGLVDTFLTGIVAQ
jgi:TetR/AcrR family transcriptional regulator, acrAB operon repressor